MRVFVINAGVKRPDGSGGWLNAEMTRMAKEAFERRKIESIITDLNEKWDLEKKSKKFSVPICCWFRHLYGPCPRLGSIRNGKTLSLPIRVSAVQMGGHERIQTSFTVRAVFLRKSVIG